MTGEDAAERVLFINIGVFKYGTDDKTHAGSMFLSLVLLFVMATVGIIGLFAPNADSFKTALGAFGGAFSFVAGVAIGRGSAATSKPGRADEREEEDL